MQLKKQFFYVIVFILLLLTALYFFPYFFSQVLLWQREFIGLISGYLHQIEQSPIRAGSLLIAISFLYGIFHAVGPGHGKFIIASYLSTHESKLTASMKLSFLASLVQGIVAIASTSVVVVLMHLSSSYFKLSQLWLERIAFGLLFLLGLYWIYQGVRNLWRQFTYKLSKPMINKIYELKPMLNNQSAVLKKHKIIDYHQNCSCGHQHLPSSQQLEEATNVKSQLLMICSIGMRPCSGAIFILFLSYMLKLYSWGMLSALAMAVGTGITLSAFALLVRYARLGAIRLGQFYALSAKKQVLISITIKIVIGFILAFTAVTLIYSTILPTKGGTILLGY